MHRLAIIAAAMLAVIALVGLTPSRPPLVDIAVLAAADPGDNVYLKLDPAARLEPQYRGDPKAVAIANGDAAKAIAAANARALREAVRDEQGDRLVAYAADPVSAAYDWREANRIVTRVLIAVAATIISGAFGWIVLGMWGDTVRAVMVAMQQPFDLVMACGTDRERAATYNKALFQFAKAARAATAVYAAAFVLFAGVVFYLARWAWYM